MRVAVIDMGTNTFHLLIVELENNDFRVLYREKTAVRIGKDGINRGLITDDAWERALITLKTFKKVTESYRVDDIRATATSAIRNARNGSKLIDDILDKTGISTRIISGEEEARYIYFGVKKALDIGTDPVLIMDIGGGSIEFIIAEQSQIHWLHSFEIGGQRMIEKFHQNDPITPNEISALEQYLASELQLLFEQVAVFQPKTLIGSSGTFDTLSEISLQKNNQETDPDTTEYPLTLESFEEIFQDIISKDREGRLAIKGMIPLRVDMIVVASILIKFILDSLDIKNVRVSAYALKEGVLLKTIEELNKKTIH